MRNFGVAQSWHSKTASCRDTRLVFDKHSSFYGKMQPDTAFCACPPGTAAGRRQAAATASCSPRRCLSTTLYSAWKSPGAVAAKLSSLFDRFFLPFHGTAGNAGSSGLSFVSEVSLGDYAIGCSGSFKLPYTVMWRSLMRFIFRCSSPVAASWAFISSGVNAASSEL